MLRDPAADAALADEGHTTMAILSASEVSDLLDAYRGLVPEDEEGVQLDFVREDRDLVRLLSKELQTMLEPRVDELFCDHWPVLTSFIVKHPGPGSDFYLHRDVPVNDERTTRCFTLWIPLVDVGPSHRNGGLGVVPRSEHLPSGQYGFDASILAEPFVGYLHELLQPVDLEAGCGLVYDGRLLHASEENRSDAPRPAIGCLLGRRSEALTHVVPTGRRHRRVYAIDRDFFVQHHPAEIVTQGMPDGYPLVDEYDEEDALDADLLQRLLGDVPRPRATTPIPADLAARGFPDADTLASRPSGLPEVRSDLALAAGDLEPLGDRVAGAMVMGSAGGVGHLALVAAGRPVAPPPAVLPPLGRWARGRTTRELALIAVDPGGRVEIAVPGRFGTRYELAVLEAPQVRAGLATPAATTVLEPGRTVDLAPDEGCTLWNGGPGPAVVLLRRTTGRRRSTPGPARGGVDAADHHTPIGG